jgi:hypothetical protein
MPKITVHGGPSIAGVTPPRPPRRQVQTQPAVEPVDDVEESAVEHEPTADPEPPYEDRTKADLLDELDRRNTIRARADLDPLSTRGTKADLIDRLTADDGESAP